MFISFGTSSCWLLKNNVILWQPHLFLLLSATLSNLGSIQKALPIPMMFLYWFGCSLQQQNHIWASTGEEAQLLSLLQGAARCCCHGDRRYLQNKTVEGSADLIGFAVNGALTLSFLAKLSGKFKTTANNLTRPIPTGMTATSPISPQGEPLVSKMATPLACANWYPVWASSGTQYLPLDIVTLKNTQPVKEENITKSLLLDSYITQSCIFVFVSNQQTHLAQEAPTNTNCNMDDKT